MDVDKLLIADGKFIIKLFNLNVKHQPENLMNFMKKTGTHYFDEKRCQEAEMFVEQAYIILDKSKNEIDPSGQNLKQKREEKRALSIMMEKSCPENDQKFLILAIEFNILDSFLDEYIKKAGSNTDKISDLLQHVDYMSEPKTIKNILQQYGEDIKIG